MANYVYKEQRRLAILIAKQICSKRFNDVKYQLKKYSEVEEPVSKQIKNVDKVDYKEATGPVKDYIDGPFSPPDPSFLCSGVKET